MDQNPSSSKIDRKTVEKNRRNKMKTLYSSLISLVPHDQVPREAVSLSDQIEGATNYIKNLEAKLERMKQKKNCRMGLSAGQSTSTGGGLNVPSVDVRVMGSALEVILITELNCKFMFSETIRMLHEEGVEVVKASFSVLDNTVFHTIHSQIGQSALDYGAVARISERLRKLIYDAN